jgi:secondary thiamine-phosphate synthase enzyme
VADLADVFEKIAPRRAYYKHNETWGDGNGYAHVRAAVVGPSLTVPFQKKRLLLGTWQQIIFLDFDNRSRSRTIIVQLMGG